MFRAMLDYYGFRCTAYYKRQAVDFFNNDIQVRSIVNAAGFHVENFMSFLKKFLNKKPDKKTLQQLYKVLEHNWDYKHYRRNCNFVRSDLFKYLSELHS